MWCVIRLASIWGCLLLILFGSVVYGYGCGLEFGCCGGYLIVFCYYLVMRVSFTGVFGEFGFWWWGVGLFGCLVVGRLLLVLGALIWFDSLICVG